MKRSIPIICISLLMLFMLIPSSSIARPVSYPGGWTLMQMNDEDRSLFHLHYSPTSKYSLGYSGGYWHDKKYQTHSLQVNNLIKRWNKPQSQANVYLKSGIGVAYEDSHRYSDRVEPHAFTGLSTDWETRRLYTQYENSYHYSGQIERAFAQHIQLGIAPYLGEYGDLHTWLMVKVEHKPENEDHFTVTPLLRFFKGVYLWEIGFSENKKILANIEIRF